MKRSLIVFALLLGSSTLLAQHDIHGSAKSKSSLTFINPQRGDANYVPDPPSLSANYDLYYLEKGGIISDDPNLLRWYASCPYTIGNKTVTRAQFLHDYSAHILVNTGNLKVWMYDSDTFQYGYGVARVANMGGTQVFVEATSRLHLLTSKQP